MSSIRDMVDWRSFDGAPYTGATADDLDFEQIHRLFTEETGNNTQ